MGPSLKHRGEVSQSWPASNLHAAHLRHTRMKRAAWPVHRQAAMPSQPGPEQQVRTLTLLTSVCRPSAGPQPLGVAAVRRYEKAGRFGLGEETAPMRPGSSHRLSIDPWFHGSLRRFEDPNGAR
ncbi:hypothetical protein SCAR479_06878 [Seiridium cardinale]|uniref:Uncharacterized protein n=1 Tax=Seiridium cardinale TaxID=138064 RepID=A0ABR2XS90_9PEZI